MNIEDQPRQKDEALKRILFTPVFLVITAFGGAAYGQSVKQAEALFDKNELFQSLEMAKSLRKNNPNDADVLGLIGRIHFELGHFKEAQTLLARAEALSPESWGDLCGSIRARMAFFYGQDKTAKTLLQGLDESWVTKELPILMNPKGLTRIKSKKGHYYIYCTADLVKKKGDVYAGQLMDAISAAYSKIFPFKRDPKIIYRAYIFGSSQAFNAFNAKLGANEQNSSGYFSPSTKTLVINGDPRGVKNQTCGLTSDVVDTMLHEGFHQFVHMFVPNIPKWFDEGLAEYFGPSQFLGKKKLKVGVVIKHDKEGFQTRFELIRGALRAEDPVAPLSLKDFLSDKNNDFSGDSQRGSMNYAQAWSFIHFLLHSKAFRKKGKGIIKKYFEVLRMGKSSAQAYQETFGKYKIEKLEKAWKQYVLGL